MADNENKDKKNRWQEFRVDADEGREPRFLSSRMGTRQYSIAALMERIIDEVEAEYDFKVIEVLVKDGSPVEYDMPLFLIEKI